MRAVRRVGTEAERRLESALRRWDFRFRRHALTIGCRPDIVFPAERFAVFVDGDFWHGRLAVEHGPKALQFSFSGPSRAFWVAKIERNIARDLRQSRKLRRHGWSVLRLWEKDILKNPIGAALIVARRIQRRRIIRQRDVA